MSSTLHEEPPVLPQSMSFWRRTFLYGKKVSSTLHEEPSVLPQSMSFWRRTFLYGFGCQKFFPAVPLGRLHKRILCKWLLYDGEETQKSWKPMLNTIFALRGSSECSVQPIAKQVLRHHFFVQSAKRHCREDLLTPESYMLKKYLTAALFSPAAVKCLYRHNVRFIFFGNNHSPFSQCFLWKADN